MLNKRILSLLLAIVLVVGLMPTSVFATETEGTTAPTESVPETTGEAVVLTDDGEEDGDGEGDNLCEVCKEPDCSLDHKYCEKCEKYDCGKPHVICEICKVEDCGVEHEQCDLCGAYDCGGEHEYCTECDKFNCGIDHNAACDKCGVPGCTKAHIWCDTCQKEDCGVLHVWCDTCQKNDCGIDHTVTEPSEGTTVPEEEETEPAGPQVGDKIWIKTGSKVYADYTKGNVWRNFHTVWGNYEAEIVAVIADENGDAVWYEYKITGKGLGEAWVGAYKYVAVSSTTTQQPEEETTQPAEPGVKEITVDGMQIGVFGEIPESVSLTAKPVSAPVALSDSISAEPDHYAFSLDITLMDGDEEWQPKEGKPVTVTVDVPNIEDGNVIAVYHEDGKSGEMELVGLNRVEDSKISFEATGFSVYTGVIIYYEYAGKWYPVTHKEVSVASIIHELTGADTSGLTESAYAHVFTQNDQFGNWLGDAGHLFDWRIKDGYVYIKPFGSSVNYIQGAAFLKVALFPYEKDGEGNYLLDNNGNKIPGTNAAYEFTVRTSVWNYHYLPTGETLYVLFQDNTFYTCTENGAIIEELPCTSLLEVSATGWNTYGYKKIKVLMDDTYQAGYDRSKYNDQLEAIYPGADQSFEIERYPGFKDPLIQVNYNPASTFDLGVHVIVDNKSGNEKDLTAIKIVKSTGTDGISYGGLMIFRGTLMDSDAEEAGEYRGTGVLIVSDSDTAKPTDRVDRGEGGILELEDGCTIKNFKIGVDQRYGTTALTYRTPGTSGNPENHKAEIHVTNNERSIVLHHHNRIEKWSTFSLGFPDLKIYLEEIDEWDSGDIVLASGYEWRKNPNGMNGSKYPQDHNNSYDHYWTPVMASDADGISFANGSGLKFAMGLAYHNPHPDEFNNPDKFKNWDNVQFTEPYPVIRFTKQTVYNVDRKTWHFTLSEAVKASQAGNELVFYGNTQESEMVIIPHNLTIRSAYAGEISYGSATSDTPVQDERGGKDYTATWNSSNGKYNNTNYSGSCIQIMNNATVTLAGEANGNTCGTLTLDANEKGRVIVMYGSTTLNMEDGITLTNGKAVGPGGAIAAQGGGNVNITGGVITKNTAMSDGGAIHNNGHTLTISGGSITDNNADGKGDGIYQGGTFNLSGDPEFRGHPDEDVYLPATATKDDATGFNVITKAGNFTFEGAIKVTLGHEKKNLYDGRNVVESNNTDNIVAADLAKFKLTNLDGFNAENDEDFAKLAFVHTVNDATANGNMGRNVLELDVELKRKSADLTITKTGVDETKDGNAPFVFNIKCEATGVDMNVVIYGNDSATIKALPAGTYTVTEVNGYWRYDLNNESYNLSGKTYTTSVTVTIEGENKEVTCTNTRKPEKWLDDWAKATNNFGGQAVYDSGAAD